MISVIIPTYNREDTIERAIYSVLNQTINDIEVLVVDDCSTDNTISIVNSISDARIRLIKMEQNGGACRARNKGINEAKGDIVAFLDSDDAWKSNKLKLQLEKMNEWKCDAVFSKYQIHSLKHKQRCIELPILSTEENNNLFERILYANCVAMDTLMVKRHVLDYIYFDEELSRYQDWDLVIRISKDYDIRFIDETVTDVYEQTNSITNSTSNKKKFMAISKIYDKYYDDIIKYPKVDSHFNWTIGLYAASCGNNAIKYINTSIEKDPYNIKKWIVKIMFSINMGNFVGKLYSYNH